jgi:hypothetical protein
MLAPPALTDLRFTEPVSQRVSATRFAPWGLLSSALAAKFRRHMAIIDCQKQPARPPASALVSNVTSGFDGRLCRLLSVLPLHYSILV